MAGHHMRGFLRTVVATLRTERAQGNPWGPFPKNKSFIEKLRKWQKGLLPDDDYSELEKESLFLLMRKVDELVQERECNYPVWDCERQEVDDLVKLASSAHSAFGGSEKDFLLVDADTPLPFSVDDLVLSIEANSELMGTQDYIDTMILRIRTLLANSRMKTITSSEDDLTLEKWLEDYICPSGYYNGAVTVIDLSLVPPEVIHIVAAVIARTTLEALQRHRTLRDGKTLPTVLIMEEAHTFVRKYAADGGEQMSAYSMCTQVFEKIAREGRKFGLGLVLSSQRPSELSPTVLSQCNSFLLHRISNDRDQDLVHRLVPDNLRGLLGGNCHHYLLNMLFF